MLEVRNLHMSYRQGDRTVEVLSGLSLSVKAGESLAVTGASGVGKSTLLHILGTLERPTGGEVFYEGENVFLRDDAGLAEFRNRYMGFVFQFHHLLPEFTALENVMMPGLIGRLPIGRTEEKARRVLEEVGLAHRLGHRPGELSGGEQQRVAVARAVVMEPRIILADEPTGNLDPRTGEQVHDILTGLNRSRRITLVVVTHSARLAAKMQRRITLRDGKAVEEEGGRAT